MRRLLALGFLIVGLTCLAWYGSAQRARAEFQREQSQALDRAIVHEAAIHVPRRHLPKRELVGRLEIPRVGLSTMVVEGDDEETLSKSVGHLPDTVLPWQVGNSAVSGHRDTFFRPLKDVRLGDEIRFTTPEGTFRYRVHETQITTPNNVGVLTARRGSELTLVTCYPFYYVGSAPKRYVVRAERLD